jgi:transcriptional regulator
MLTFSLFLVPLATLLMYIPRTNAEHDSDVLFDFIDAHPLATLVTSSAEHGLFATHLPLILRRTDGPHGTLEGHVARANPQHQHVRELAAGSEVLVIFTGANAYISPNWYASKAEHGRVVPTWNYIAVHAYGTTRVSDDESVLRPHLERLVARHEGKHPAPWTMGAAPADYIQQQLRAIVAVEIAITRLEGKWKMSQNRPAGDIDGVIRGLSESDRPEDREVADIVAERRPKV